MLTIVYCTARRHPMIHWFYQSLQRELSVTPIPVEVVVVDFHYNAVPLTILSIYGFKILTTAPKPSVFSGPHRLTSVNYFTAANARNTGICFAKGGWIAFVDDISVLMPGWLSRVKLAMDHRYIVCGAYKKVNGLVVTNGEATYYEEEAKGVDSRWSVANSGNPAMIEGGQMYGCSVAMPLKAILEIGGFDETHCDSLGLGSEDYIAGMMLQQAGHKLMYDREMLTLESEERHHWETPMKRVILKPEQIERKTAHDASWEILLRVRSGELKKAVNESCGPGGLVELRNIIQNGGVFPILNKPDIEWYSGRPVHEF